jgi:hypothetical protein
MILRPNLRSFAYGP